MPKYLKIHNNNGKYSFSYLDATTVALIMIKKSLNPEETVRFIKDFKNKRFKKPFRTRYILLFFLFSYFYAILFPSIP